MSEELKVGMHKCTVCNREFELKGENHYITEARRATGLAVLIGSTETALYDTVDCPYCGCQQILHVREKVFVENNFDVECEEEPEELCEKCQECANKDKYQDEEPCCDCDPRGDAKGFVQREKQLQKRKG